MQIKKLLLVGLIMSTAAYASAQEIDWKVKMEELRAQHAALKAQVTAGTLTKEAARTQWTAIMQDVRAKKDQHFQDRMAKAQERIAKISPKNPELAAKIQERVTGLTQKRADMIKHREELRAQVKAGTITKEQLKTDMEKKRSEIKEFRTEKRAEIKEMRDKMKDSKKSQQNSQQQ